VNVRSLSPESGGTLLPFRGQGKSGEERGPHDAEAPEPVDSPTVVHLTGRRAAGRGTAGRQRPPWVRYAVALASVVLVAGGAAAAALTGVLPLSTERPQPRPAVSAPPTSAEGQGTNVPAAYGLCKAFDRAAERGDDVATALAFRNLANAAGGASAVSAYCAPFDDLDRGRAR
jgi:hypothetical protein